MRGILLKNKLVGKSNFSLQGPKGTLLIYKKNPLNQQSALALCF